MEYLAVCKVRCKKCGDVLGREYQSANEHGGPMEYCSCGAIGFDPDPITWRVAGDIEDIEKMFEVCDPSKETVATAFMETVTAEKTIDDIIQECPRGLLTRRNVYWDLFEGARIYVIWLDTESSELRAEWKTFDHIYSFIDINDFIFKDESSFLGEEYGSTWVAYANYSVEEEKRKYIAELKKRMGKE